MTLISWVIYFQTSLKELSELNFSIHDSLYCTLGNPKGLPICLRLLIYPKYSVRGEAISKLPEMTRLFFLLARQNFSA